MRAGAAWRAGALAAALVVAACEAAHAALPAPPFDLSVSPARLVEGAPTTVTITRAPHAAGGSSRYDVYLVWALAERAAFLTPAGTWSPARVPYLRGVATEGFTPSVSSWPRVGPAGDLPLAMVVVPGAVDPMDRARWTFRPVMRWLSVAHAAPAAAPPASRVVALAVAAAVASLLVLLGPKVIEFSTRGSTPSESGPA